MRSSPPAWNRDTEPYARQDHKKHNANEDTRKDDDSSPEDQVRGELDEKPYGRLGIIMLTESLWQCDLERAPSMITPFFFR